MCESEGLPIIEDDVYRDVWIDQMPPRPLKANDRNGNVLYIGSLSKTVSPGLRIGWVVGPQTVIDRLADIKMQSDYGSSSLSQWAAAEWLSSGLYEEHLVRVRQQLKIRRDTAISILEQHFRGIASWDIPQGGFYIWLQLHKPISIGKLFETALRENILLNPGNLYDPDVEPFLRISYSYAALPELEKGLCRLAKLIKEA